MAATSNIQNESRDWVPNFELGEDIRDESRLRQDEEWAGAVADGRSHVSHRELAMLHAPQFCMAIEDYKVVELLVRAMYRKGNIMNMLNHEMLRTIIVFAIPGQGPLVSSAIEWRSLIERERELEHSYLDQFRVCLRKRPLLDFERNFGSFDVCYTDSTDTVTIHDGKLARNGRRLSMTHHHFLLDRVFDEAVDNEQLCRTELEPLLSWAKSGHCSTFLCFGQTGTGKTYTLYGALEYLSRRLVGSSLEVTFFEVHGSKCYDLMSERNVVHLRADENDEMHLRGATSTQLNPLEHPNQLISLLRGALNLRSSKVTERNPISSRSHAVCTLKFLDASQDASHGFSGESSQGQITLVDLAGSERNYETTAMTAAQHKESADINFALMNLKNCFRAYQDKLTHIQTQSIFRAGGNVRIPFRSSLLTKVLKSCFTSGQEHRTTIMTTMSPTPVDLQHSLNSIAHVVKMSKRLATKTARVTVEVPLGLGAALSHTPVHQWTHQQVIAWLGSVERGRFAQLVLPPSVDGEGLLNLTATHIAELFGTQERVSRQENEGAAWVVTAEESAGQLSIARALWFAVRRQQQSALAQAKVVALF